MTGIRIPWPHKSCILCLKPAQLTEEHLIPEAIGGRLTADFLCSGCNSQLGHRVEATVKADPAIALAIHRFHSKYPDVAAPIREGMAYRTQGTGAESRALVRRGKLVFRSERLSDGSLVQPTEVARRTVSRMLEKRGYPESPIEQALQRFDSAPEGERTELVPGLEIIKGGGETALPDLSGPSLDHTFLHKVAYEFLACHLGSAIYQDVTPLNALRSELLGSVGVKAPTEIQELRADRIGPIHGVVLESGEPTVSIQIRLFGSLAYRIRIPRLAYAGPRFVYSHDLIKNVDGARRVPDTPTSQQTR